MSFGQEMDQANLTAPRDHTTGAWQARVHSCHPDNRLNSHHTHREINGEITNKHLNTCWSLRAELYLTWTSSGQCHHHPTFHQTHGTCCYVGATVDPDS